MHHFVIEFITGGGMAEHDLPASLTKEGEMMLQSLLRELCDAGESNISICRDSRLKLDNPVINEYLIEKSLLSELPQIIGNPDVMWLIAPESDSVLYDLANTLFSHGNNVMLSNLEAIKITSNKMMTFNYLRKHKIPTINTAYATDQNTFAYPCVIKPIDGVGGEGCRILNSDAELNDFLKQESPQEYIIQPYLEGEHLSISMLVHENGLQLIGCNRQYLTWQNNQHRLIGLGVNEALSYKDTFQRLAESIIKAIPGLEGFIGVDVIDYKDECYVVEINPRFTTAYAGLSESIDQNIAKILLNNKFSNKITEIDLNKAKPVYIDL